MLQKYVAENQGRRTNALWSFVLSLSSEWYTSRMTSLPETETRTVTVLHAGRMDYTAAWARQRELGRMRSAGAIADTLMLVEHPHTYTFGSRPKPEQLLVSHETLAAQGVALVEADRGGDITYHGPGQIVGYPILKLSRYGGDVLRYLRMLEETIIVALAGYGIAGERIAGLTGVWVGGAKICAIGVKLSASGVTQHGFALNVNTDLRFFEQIIPCGIADRGVTSLERVLGSAPPRGEVEARVVATFGQVFGAQIE